MAYEKRVLVDGETPLNKDLLDHIQDGIAAAHDSIGTADISGIGDGTIKGAILALKALIESGGGGSGGATGDFAIVLKNKNEYINNSAWMVGDEKFYEVDPTRRVPTMEQMEGCSMVCTIGGENVKFHSPIIEESPDEVGINYLVRFEKVYAYNDDYEHWYDGYHLYVITTGEGVCVNFDGLIETFNNALEASHSDFQGGTLTFQAPQSGDSGGGEDIYLPADAYEVDVYNEDNYGESADMPFDETCEGRLVDSQVPTLLQMQRCDMYAFFPGEASCTLDEPEVVDYLGDGRRYAIYFRNIPSFESSLELDIPHLLVNTDETDHSVGVYVVFEAFSQTHSAIWEGEEDLESATIYFPEVQ